MVAQHDIETLRGLIEGAERVLLTGPEDPDGDSIGACLALARTIRRFARATVEVAGTPSFRYAWMDGADKMVPDAQVRGPYDLAIVLDGDRHRLTPVVREAFYGAKATAIIDHHGTTSAEGYTLAVIDRKAESTCGMILRCMDAWNIQLDPQTAAQLYTGIIFDTGCFRHSNTSGATHLVAARLLEQGIDHSAIAIKVLLERRRSGMALQARVLDNATFHAASRVVQGVVSRRVMDQLGSTEADVEGIVEAMIYVEGVEVAVLIVERGPELVKLSLRSRGQVDVSAVARALHTSGGGHAKAAGVILRESLADVVGRVPRAIELAFGEPVRAVSGHSAVKAEAAAGLQHRG